MSALIQGCAAAAPNTNCSPAPCETIGGQTLYVNQVVRANPTIQVAGLGANQQVTTVAVTITGRSDLAITFALADFTLSDPVGNALIPFNGPQTASACPSLEGVYGSYSTTLCFATTGDPSGPMSLNWRGPRTIPLALP